MKKWLCLWVIIAILVGWGIGRAGEKEELQHKIQFVQAEMRIIELEAIVINLKIILLPGEANAYKSQLKGMEVTYQQKQAEISKLADSLEKLNKTEAEKAKKKK